jgi:sulfhydrogenase subunit gamma (sulfur reductase)
MTRSDDYVPRLAVIENIEIETKTEKTFTLRLPDDDAGMVFSPGQFLEVSVLGAGEAPFGLCSHPKDSHVFQTTVRRYPAGDVTVPLHRMHVGDYVGVRGPMGNGFRLGEMQGRDIVIVAGGLGLPTLRSAIFFMLDNRAAYGQIALLYGARTPQDRLYKRDLQDWWDSPYMECQQTVDVADEHWPGNVGYVPELLDKIQLDAPKTTVLMCGPGVMIRPVVSRLTEMGVGHDQMYINMEAHMKCGIGKCGHCLIGDKYVCLDGPVFRYDEVEAMQALQDAT